MLELTEGSLMAAGGGLNCAAVDVVLSTCGACRAGEESTVWI